MLKRRLSPREGCRPDVPRREHRAGWSALTAFAAVAVLAAGATAASFAGSHPASAATGTCQALPAPESTPPVNSSPSPSSSASPTPPPVILTQLCVSVAATADTVQQGKAATYQIEVWTTGGPAHGVTVQTSVSPGALPSPAFTSCDSGTGADTCSIGTVGKTQTIELRANISVPSDAAAGGGSTLIAAVSGFAKGATTAGSVSSAARVNIVAAPKQKRSPSSHHTHPASHHSSGSGGSGQTPSNSDLNGSPGTSQLGALGLGGSQGSGSSSNPGSLFPTIGPSSSSSGAKTHGLSDRGPYHPSAMSDVLPLNTRQMSGQVAGLLVLALGIIIAIARISVRKPRPTGKH